MYFRYILDFFQPYFLFNNACTNLCLRSTQSHICLTINMCFVLNLHSYFKCLLLSLLKYQSSTINVILAPVWTPFILWNPRGLSNLRQTSWTWKNVESWINQIFKRARLTGCVTLILPLLLILIIVIITITKFSNLIGYQLPWFQP